MRLPLAWPVVMAGVRVSGLLTVSIAAIAPLVGGDGLGTYIQDGLTRLGLPNADELGLGRGRVHRPARAGAGRLSSPCSSG